MQASTEDSSQRSVSFAEANVDTVLPIIARDLPRATRILWPSMENNLSLGGRHLVVAPDDTIDRITRVAPGWVEVIAESALIPSFPTWVEKSLLRIASVRTEFRPRNARGGWWRQQLIKLAVADEFESGNYLCLDADLLVVPSAARTVAFRGSRSLWQEIGKAKTDTSHDEHQPTWFTNAHRALGISDPGGGGVQVTPCFLARRGVASLRKRLVERAPIEEFLVRAASHRLRRDWMTSAMSLLPWTEFAMYCEWLRHTGEFDDLHFFSESDRVYGPSLWNIDSIPQWRESIESCEFNYAFVVVQSNRRVEAEADEKILRDAKLLA